MPFNDLHELAIFLSKVLLYTRPHVVIPFNQWRIPQSGILMAKSGRDDDRTMPALQQRPEVVSSIQRLWGKLHVVHEVVTSCL